MQPQRDFQELLKTQCNLTDLYRNQLQLTTYELQKSRGTIQHLRAILISFQSDFNLKSDQMSTILQFLQKSCDDDTRLANLEENFRKSLSAVYLSSYIPANTKLALLPSDVIFLILDYLEPRELTIISYTCKEIYSMCQNTKIWKSLARHLWKSEIENKNEFMKKYAQEMAWYHTRPAVSTLIGHTGSVTCLAYNPGTPYFVSGSDDCSLSMWEIDETHLKDQEIVKQHHVQTKTITKKVCYYGHGGPVWSCCIGNNSLISGSYDKTIKVWNLGTGRCEFTMRGHTGWISSIDCNDQIIVSGSWDSSFKVWDQATKHCLTTIQYDSDSVYCLQLSQPQVLVGLKSRSVDLWDLSTSQKIISCIGHYKGINAIKMHNHIAFSGSSDTLVKMWDLRIGECVVNLPGHSSNVMSLDYSFESSRVVSASYDKTIRIWDLRKTNSTRNILRGHSEPVFSVKFDDHKLISGSMDQSIKIWNFNTV